MQDILSSGKRRRLQRLRVAAACVLLGLLSAITALLFGTRVDAAEDAVPPELGRVAWLRDYDAGVTASRATGKPIFLLFQEVPGCRTCVDFGASVLSHPLLVEAIEDEFVPVAILNNRGGADRRTLERFGEPAWNNPVVRFVDAGGADLVPRRDRVWFRGEIVARMIEALEVAKRPVPAYLRSLSNDLSVRNAERATLAMHCFWRGEACLGANAGVLSTRAGHLGGREVVEVRFDADRISYASLLQAAKRAGCADAVFAHDEAQAAIARTLFGDRVRTDVRSATDARDRDRKYHLKRFATLEALELTESQATRVNHAAWRGLDPREALSPRQAAGLGQSESD